MQLILKVIALMLVVISLQAQNSDSVINWKALKIENKGFKTNYYEGDRTISKRGFEDIIKDDTLAFETYKKGKRLGIISNIIGIPASVVFGYSFGTLITGGAVGGDDSVLAVSGAVVVSTFLLNIISESRIKRAVNGYNNRVSHIEFKANQQGLGIVFTF